MNSKKTNLKGMIMCIVLVLANSAIAQIDYPKTKKVTKEMTFHGTTIKDDYNWLDDISNEEVQAWTKAQDKAFVDYARSLPQYEKLKGRISELMSLTGRMVLPVQAAGQYFYVKSDDSGGWGLFQKQKGSNDETKLELPFNPRAAFFILPSPDASKLAMGIAKPGQYFDWKVYDVKSQQLASSEMIGAHMGDTRLTWMKDGSGFYYVGMDVGADGTERSKKRIKFHQLGTDGKNDRTVYTPENEGVKLHIDVSDDGKYLVILDRQGASIDGVVKYVSTSGPNQEVKNLVPKAEASYIFLGNDGADFFFQTDLGAPNGKIVSVNINQPTRVWKDLVEEPKDPMMGFQSAGGTMLPMMVGEEFVVPSQKDLIISLKVYNKKGRVQRTINLPSGGLFFRTNGLNALSGNRDSNEVMSQFMGIVEPNTIFTADINSGEVSAFSRAKVQFDANQYVSEIKFAKSKDGTRIPISLTYKKGLKRNGKNYLMMQVYGAAAFTNYPYYQGDYMAWLDMGGIHAVAHVRGGAAYGSQWHRDGIARKKQNGIDDYIASLEWTIKNKYTSADRTVINGASAGTILVGALMVQRPDLVGGVVSHYGMLDMIGYAAKLGQDPTHGYMLPEIGKATDPDDFKVLNQYSPYQKLNSGTKYPPFLALSSELDAPLNTDSYKYVARLQEIGGSVPTFLQMAWGSGHNAFGSRQHSPVDTFTDELAFLIRAMNIDVSDWLK